MKDEEFFFKKIIFHFVYMFEETVPDIPQVYMYGKKKSNLFLYSIKKASVQMKQCPFKLLSCILITVL